MAGANNPYGDQENPWENQPKPQNYVQQSSQNPAPNYGPTRAGDPSTWNVDSGSVAGNTSGKNWWDATAQEAGLKGSWEGGMRKISQGYTSAELAKMDPGQRARAMIEYANDLGDSGSRERAWHQYMAWDKSFDPNCPPDFPYQAEDGSGCVEKPDNSNKGYQEGGGGGPGGGGGGGGRGGGRGRGNEYGNPEIYNYLKGQALDPKQWLNTFLGQGGMNQYQASVDAQRQQAMMLPEPQRSAALARINEGTMGATRQTAEAARMGLLSDKMMPQEYGYKQLGENARQANMANALGWYGAETGRIGTTGGLDLANRQFGWESGSKWADTLQQNALDRDMQMKLAKMQADAQKTPWWQKVLGGAGSLLGGAAGIAGMSGNTGGSVWSGLGKIFSDVRLKENILPETGALSALHKMPAYSYNYKGDPPSERHLGIMAQDAEKVSPHLVKEVDGFKAVDTYGLLTITMEAVKELNQKLEAKKGKR